MVALRRRAGTLLFAALALASLLAAGALPLAEAPVRFIVLGDTGTASPDQYRVAAAVEAVCAVRGCDFAIVNGDNIYENGVTSANDPQFEAKFELPYADLAFPFYMALGNHDNGGLAGAGDGSENYKGDYEVAYAQRTGRLSDKWQMPARHYTFREGPLQFWALDTNPLVFYGGLPLPGDPVWTGIDPLGLQQLLWLKEGLAASDATWKFAFAHHPYISNGQHGDAGSYDGVPTLGENVKLFLEQGACGAIDVYFTGHDHDLQWLQPVAACGATQFMVSGAGAKTRALRDPTAHAAYFERGSTLGFAWVEVAGDTFTGAYFDGDGGLLFERSFTKGS